MANKNLQAAKVAKKDEFYTQLTDIEKELRHYKTHFHGKTVICNCDDPRVSNFYKYFRMQFEHLGLKRLICTCYKHQNVDLFSDHKSEQAVYIDYVGAEENILPLKGDGDFRSQECIELLKQADIVVTNPPFSLFREYVAQLMKYGKQFLIIGHQNAVKYKEIFPFIVEGKIWLGYGFTGSAAHFISPYDDVATANSHKEGMIRVSGVTWFTNLDHDKRHEQFICYKRYNSEEYPRYDTFDAIEVCPTERIPEDYYGIMGVPITYLDKHNPEQFEVIGELNHGCDNEYDFAKPVINGKEKFPRILIRRKQ